VAAQTSEKYMRSIPKRENEMRASGSGPVISYTLSPEELAKYRSEPAKKYSNQDGAAVRKPTAHKAKLSSEEQSRRAKIRYGSEGQDMKKKKEGPDCGLTRKDLIEAIAKGETLSSVERAYGMKFNTLAYWVEKWGLKGITPIKAQKILDKEREAALQDPEPRAAEPTGKPAELDAAIALQLKQKDAEIERLNDALKGAAVVADQAGEQIRKLQERLYSYEEELARWAQRDSESSMQINELQEDRENWKRLANIFEQERNEAQQAIKELEEERQQLLTVIEKAVSPDPRVEFEHDNVNHPAHYTAGGIECIDAIEAAVIGLPGPQAYSAGAAIKYLWRYSRKNGVEDLQKAAWYVNRLIGEVDAG